MGKLEITKNDLKKRFAEYNDLYFQNNRCRFGDTACIFSTCFPDL